MSSSARNRSGRSAVTSPSVPLPWQGRPVSLATCHGKERALARRTNFTHCRVDAGRAPGETDMRAHLNPTRMASIRALAFRLVRRVARACPGFGRVELRLGLPCRWCGLATELVAAEVFGCVRCGHRQDLPRRDGLQAADPGHCLSCNP